jgi:branched-chain amino acid transport system substrate-binding protein
VAVVAAVLGAACGGDDGAGSSTGQTLDQAVAQGVNSALNGSASSAPSATTTTLPQSLEQWEALADQQRAAIVARIEDNGWGKSPDGTKVTGPEGFTIDLTKCPAGWSETEGLTDTTIKIGHTAPLSGTAADFGNGSRAMDVAFTYYSDQGVFTDKATGTTRRINLITKDDGYDSARTIPLVDELIDSDKVFAVMTTGSPTTLKVYDKLNQRCIPHPLGGITGHPAWADPVNHPWTTGLQLAYSTEAILWGAFVEQHLADLPEKVTIASLVTSNDYGKAYDSSFKAYLAQSPDKDRFSYVNELIDINAPTVTDPMTTLASKQPDVFILMGGATQCTQVAQEAEQNGMRDHAKYLITNQNCKGYMTKAKVGGDGSVSNGWWIMGGGVRDLGSTAEDGNPYIQWARQTLAASGIDYHASANFGLGFEYAFPIVQALRIAGELDGGLTRTNLMLALRTMDMTNPMLLPGVQFNLDGNKDGYFIEGSDISQFDSAKQQWVQQGPVIDLSGQSQNCAFDQATQTCR